jgi:PAS domain S-box-containing protein
MPADLDRAIDIFHPDGRRYQRDEWPAARSITSGEEIVEEEFFYALPDGGRLWIRCSCSPVRDRDGEIVAAVLAQTDVTERRRAAEQLAYHASLLDVVEDAVVGTDAELRLTVWNRGAERLYGYAADEVLGRDAREVATYEGDVSRLEVDRELVEGGRTRSEITAHRKDGTPVEVELIALAVRDERGAITGYIGTHRDIGERKRAEEALRKAQRRSAAILESMSDEFFALDRDWRYTYVNERALAETRRAAGRDVPAGELLGMSVWELMPHHVGTAAERELRRAMRERTVVELEVYSEPTGRWVEVRVYPTEDGLAGYTHDISGRKAAQEEMSRHAEQQALLAELGQRALASDDLQSLLDEAVGLIARTLDVELAGVAELVRGGEEIVFRAGFGWREGVVGARIDPVERDALVGYTLRVGEPVIVDDMATDGRFRLSAIARDHGVVSALSVMIESPDEPFGVLGALCTRRRTFSPSEVNFVQSVANVLASAAERGRAQERLGEVREAERSRIARDLHDDALQDLTDALVQADRGRSAGLAPDAADRLVSTLKRVGAQLRGAIYDLRPSDDVSRPFPDALRALIDVQRARAVDCEIDLAIARETPIGVLGNRGAEVLHIAGEALTNARRHSGARHVRVTARGSEDAGLCVEVTDDGRGFEPADKPSGTDRRGIQGMRERAALLGADLDIKSTPGTGTTVRIELATDAQPTQPRATARILLVEDHTVVRQAIAAMFEHEPDFDVVAQAGSMAEARGMLHDVDVAVLDLGLPDGHGDDLISELRDVNPHAQAIVLSASLDPAQLAHAIDSGAAAAVNKTADLNQLVDAVRRLRHGAAPPS